MDYIITTLNKISNVGLKHFSDNYNIVSGELTDNTDAVLVRSQDMLEMDFPSSLKSIARAGAGVNNIPLDRCASQGIVVFNIRREQMQMQLKSSLFWGCFFLQEMFPQLLTGQRSSSRTMI